MRVCFRILCKCFFSEVTVQAVIELDNKMARCFVITHTIITLLGTTIGNDQFIRQI